MRILFHYLARWHTVNWTRYHSLLSALADAGHEIHVLQSPPLSTTEGNFQEVDAVEQPNLHLHEVLVNRRFWKTHFPLNKLIKKSYYSLCSLGEARRLIETEQIDVLLLYNLPQYRLSKLMNVVQVFDIGDDYLDMLREELGRADNPLARAVAGRMLRGMMDRADLVTCISHELASRMPCEAHVLPNGVNLEKSERCRNTTIPPIESAGKPVVGFLGSFEYFIDFQQLLDVAQLLPQYHFLFVGAGREWEPTRQSAIARGLQNVQFTGGVPHAQVFAYIDAMDICLHLFRPIAVSHRACPIKLFEYLSLKKPVISTRLHELQHIDEGFLYYGDTPEEVAEQIEHIFAHPDEARQRAAAGYAKVAAHYTWPGVAARFVELVEPHLLAARQQPSSERSASTP